MTRPKAKIYFNAMQLNTLNKLLTAKGFFEESTVVRPVAMSVSLDLCCDLNFECPELLLVMHCIKSVICWAVCVGCWTIS